MISVNIQPVVSKKKESINFYQSDLINSGEMWLSLTTELITTDKHCEMCAVKVKNIHEP